MVYDYTTDINNFTRLTTTPAGVITWAVTQAKTIYIGADAANYNDDVSNVDNRLVSMLASAFVVMYNYGVNRPTEFVLDELRVKENVDASPEDKFFDMFFYWLHIYQSKGVTLQYKDSTDSLILSDYDPADYVVEKTSPPGLEQ